MPPRYERPKGFVDWNPREQTRVVLSQVQDILDQYKQYGAMTCRQIFYRLVGQYDYAKTENAYNNLCEYLVRARRAQIISFNSIRDDGTIYHPAYWRGFDHALDERQQARAPESPDTWWDLLEDEWRSFARDRTYGQELDIELWCEAGGMAPMLAGIAQPYGVPVYSTGGFSSVTVTRQIALRAARKNRSTVFLHVGDFDPSGESIFDSMARDAGKFFYQSKHWEDKEEGWYGDNWHVGHHTEGLEFLPVRLALTEEQVSEYDLPTAPPKRSDSRSAAWEGETCQLEAMAPDDLAQVIVEAIEERFDMDVYHDNLKQETRERSEVKDEWERILRSRDY